MLFIAVVDDDAQDTKRLKDQVEHYFLKTGEAFILRTYQDGVDFIRSTECYDIVFMDIRMEKLDGVEAARFIRKINQDTVLIYVTHMAQYAIRGYEVDALGFILKPSDQFSIDHVLNKAMKRIQNRLGVSLVLKTATGIISISSSSIYYLEVFDHVLIYHTEDGEYKVRGRMGDVRKLLDEQQFILSSRSYLVNLRYITSVHNDYLVVNGDKVPISKSHRQEIKKRFVNYLGENL